MLAVSIILILVLAFILLKSSKVQNSIAREITKQVAAKLHTKVSVGNISYEYFNTFSFNSFYIQDQQNDTLLYVDKAYANFDFWKFFSGKISFNEIELQRLQGNLVIHENGVSNLDFVLKALQSKKKNPQPSNVEFNVKKLKISNSNFTFSNLKNKPNKDTTVFDPNRMRFSQINAFISLEYLKNDSLAGNIGSLSLKERSGLQIKNLNTYIYGWKHGFWFPSMKLFLPNTDLAMDSVKMSYDSISHLKDILTKVRWAATVQPSKINLADLSPFFRNFRNMKQPAYIQGKVKGTISSFRTKSLNLRYGNTLQMTADVDLDGIPKLSETFIYADVKDFQVNKPEAQDVVAKIMGKPFVLPKELSRLGTVRYKGKITGFFSNLVSYGNISTNIGNVKTDILLQFENDMKDLRYNGSVSSSGFDVGKLLASKDIGKASFTLNTNGSKLQNRPFQGKTSGDIANIYLNKYNYKNIKLNGKYDGNGFDGKFNIKDPNLVADFEGVVDLSKKLPVWDFQLNVAKADVNALKLTDKYKNSHLSFTGTTKMTGNSLDNLNGFLTLRDIRFVNGDKTLNFDEFNFRSEVGRNNSKFFVTSDLINGYFEGDFKYSAIPQTIKAIAENYIPALSGRSAPNKNAKGGNNFMNIDLTVSDTKLLSQTLELPFATDGVTTIKGYVDDINQKIDITAQTPYISFNHKKIQDVKVELNNQNNKLNLTGHAGYYLKKDLLLFNVKATAANDSLYSQIEWENSDSVKYAGELQAITKFQKINNFTTAQIAILPTQTIISDTIWNISPSRITINPDSTYSVRNFKLSKNGQYINLDGKISKRETDTLTVKMSDLQIGYIFDMLNLSHTIDIRGKATGKTDLYGILKKPAFDADLFVEKASLNGAHIGDANVRSTWDGENQRVLASGTFFGEKNDTVITAGGFYAPKNDSIDFNFHADKLNIGFLQKYLGSIAKNIQGQGTGIVRMFGTSKTLGFEGKVYAENTRATIDYLKTTYSFSDTVYIKRKSIRFTNITFYDDEKNTGTLTGLVNHDGNFNNITYDVQVFTRNILAMNTREQDNSFFFGKAYAGGTVHISGDEKNTRFNINVTSRPKTKFYLALGNTETIKNNDFITFVAKNKEEEENGNQKQLKTTAHSTSGISLDMTIEATPDADLQLVIDPKSGDNITAKGSGDLRLTYDNNNDLRLYGGYTIDNGVYNFSLQNLIHKQFKIDQGSSITWSGNPFLGKIDIRAIYSTTASLRDLMDESLMAYTTRTSVPVNTIMHISDDLMHPGISFDIDLPSSDEALKMQVKSLISTQELLNRQVAYLLLFGKFYSPTANDFATSSSGTGVSFLATTLFGQLNNWLSQVTNNFSMGLNYRNTGNEVAKSSELETEISFQPNSRTIVNGNLGYRFDDLAKNKIIGDLDVEYILTNNGKFRLKAYNHTVDKYTLRSAEFIQGVGVVYKESFNSWDELARYYWSLFAKKNKKTNYESNPIKRNDETK